jgi:hypothetical protein
MIYMISMNNMINMKNQNQITLSDKNYEKKK